MKINARLLPTSLHRTFREVSQGGDFGESQPTEELQVNKFSKFRLHLRQLIQCIADAREFFRVDEILDCVGFKRSDLELTAALDRVAASGVIDDQSAHHTRRIPHEARSVGKRAAFVLGYAQISPRRGLRTPRVCGLPPPCFSPLPQWVQPKGEGAK